MVQPVGRVSRVVEEKIGVEQVYEKLTLSGKIISQLFRVGEMAKGKMELNEKERSIVNYERSVCENQAGNGSVGVDKVFKKKGKWKRWAKEWGWRVLNPVGEPILDKRIKVGWIPRLIRLNENTILERSGLGRSTGVLSSTRMTEGSSS
ncbi:hypothetical protein QYF36_021459 [Acer negundo]|nr:hypothetical protein QYF36_021459 [Acer negundo]